jgi:hypothetical protein
LSTLFDIFGFLSVIATTVVNAAVLAVSLTVSWRSYREA